MTPSDAGPRPVPPAGPRRPSLLVLVVASAVQPFAINVLAPATPALARQLQADYGTVQLTLSVYLLAVAVTQLVIGPISDRIGRRPCVVGGLVLFTLGSLIGLFADDIVALLAGRVLQAAGAGTAFALSRAIVRDTAGKDEAASLIGYITMAMVVAPMVAPLLGGVLDARFGWRAIFLSMVVVGVVASALAWRMLNETHLNRIPGSWLATFQAFPALVRIPAFLGHALLLTAVSMSFFVFLAGAPYVVVEHMGRGPEVYGLFFTLNATAYMLGNFLSGRFSQRMGADRMAGIGLALSTASVIAAAILALVLPWTPAVLFLPLLLNGVGNGLTIPCATAAALSARPDLAGAASGLMGFLQLGLGALAAWACGLVTPIWPPTFLAMMLGAMVLGIVGYRLSQRGA